jgi:hypothetical protein
MAASVALDRRLRKPPTGSIPSRRRQTGYFAAKAPA